MLLREHTQDLSSPLREAASVRASWPKGRAPPWKLETLWQLHLVVASSFRSNVAKMRQHWLWGWDGASSWMEAHHGSKHTKGRICL